MQYKKHSAQRQRAKQIRYWRAISLGMASAGALLSGCGGSSTGPGNGGETGLIAFASDRDGNSEIYVMAPNGTNPMRVTNESHTDTRPSLSSDRSRIVFESARGVPEESLLAKTRGAKSNSVRPRHAPEGANIWSINLTSANPESSAQQLTNSNKDFAPVISRNGQRIVFRSERDGNSEIYVMNANGSNPQRLTNDAADDRDPDISPDGTKIVFASNRENIAAIYDIWMINADGSGTPQRLTSNTGSNLGPVFSPDGTRISFWSTRSGNSDIWTMNAANGSNPQQVTNNVGNDRFPSWSPDGRKLVFYSNRTGGEEIWKIEIANGQETQLTNNANEEDFPDWR